MKVFAMLRSKPCELSFLLAMAISSAACGEDSADTLLQQAQTAARAGDHQAAADLATKAIAKNDQLAFAYYLRGCEHFFLAKIKESVADFDRFVELSPERESRLWERGISHYYAKMFDQGAKQFELYQTFYNNDVENSVWRYLCMVPKHGVDESRAAMLPIENDRRVPMMQIYEMFRGNLTPEKVLETCRQGNPPTEVLDGRLFYAHLYLGLYYESLGQTELARKYIELAAEERLAKNDVVSGYMWGVARVHADLTRKPNANSKP